MTTVPFTTYQVVSAIIDGDLDDDLESIESAIRSRSKLTSLKKAAMFKTGDKVRFVKGSPKYLLGLSAVIIRKKQKNFVIKFDEFDSEGKPQYRGRFTGQVTCGPDLLEKIVEPVA